MIDAPLALAFGAGLVATVNPCGFAMLPAYLSYFVGLDGDEAVGRVGSVRRALIIGSVMSVGFLLVFGTAGIIISLGFQSLTTTVIPWLALGIGVLIALLGIAMLWGFEPVVGLPKAKRAGTGSGYRSVFGFGVSYAIASLSCTLPVFLTVVAGQITRTNFVSGLATFIAYGLGMSLVLLGITIALALGKRSLVGRLRQSGRYINRVAGAILVLAGGYIVWFWGTNLASGATALGDSGAFRFVETLSARALNLVQGNVAAWGLGLGILITAAVLYVLLREDAPDEPDGHDGGTPELAVIAPKQETA